MNDNDMPEKSDIQLKNNKFGVNIPVPTIRLSDKHPCCGCVWYDRDTDVLSVPQLCEIQKWICNAKER